MIYLIDDNQNNVRVSEYKISYIENNYFANHLTSISKLELRNDIDDISHLKFLKSADCILLHSTIEDVDEAGKFIPGSITNSIKIKELISDYGNKIPLVLFSNSLSEKAAYNFKETPNFIRAIKKNIFYNRLYDFLEKYQNENIIELRIIAYGYNFHAYAITEFANEILAPIAFIDDDKLKIEHIPNILAFQGFFELAFNQRNWKEFLFDLEDHPMLIEDFRKRIYSITNSFIKYGRNIYNWR